MLENMDQNNSENGHFLRSVHVTEKSSKIRLQKDLESNCLSNSFLVCKKEKIYLMVVIVN